MLDPIDQLLLASLRSDGRSSWAALGAITGLSADAVKVRVDRLITDDIGRLVTLVDPRAFGYDTQIVVGVSLLGDPAPFLEWARKQDSLIHLVRVAGHINFFAEIIAMSLADAHDIAFAQMGALPGVVSVEVIPVLGVERWRHDTRWQQAPAGKRFDLSDADIEILRVLVHSPRMSLTAIADLLQRPYPQLRRRLQTLYRHGVVKTTLVVDDAMAFGSASAFLMVRREGDISRMADALLSLPEVTILVATTGRYAFTGEMLGCSFGDIDRSLRSLGDRVSALIEAVPYIHVEKLPASLSF